MISTHRGRFACGFSSSPWRAAGIDDPQGGDRDRTMWLLPVLQVGGAGFQQLGPARLCWDTERVCAGVNSFPERKLHGSKEPGVKTPLQVLPTIPCRVKNFLPPKKGMDAKMDYVQLPADPSLWPVSGIPCPSC